jgi:hypothetical protein
MMASLITLECDGMSEDTSRLWRIHRQNITTKEDEMKRNVCTLA